MQITRIPSTTDRFCRQPVAPSSEDADAPSRQVGRMPASRRRYLGGQPAGQQSVAADQDHGTGAARLPGLRDTESLLQSNGQCRRGLDTLAELATDRFRLTRANGSEPQMPRALTLADDVDDLAVVVETREGPDGAPSGPSTSRMSRKPRISSTSTEGANPGPAVPGAGRSGDRDIFRGGRRCWTGSGASREADARRHRPD